MPEAFLLIGAYLSTVTLIISFSPTLIKTVALALTVELTPTIVNTFDAELAKNILFSGVVAVTRYSPAAKSAVVIFTLPSLKIP